MNTVDVTTLSSEAEPSARPSTFRDWLGIVASIGCAIHCAAMPFVFAYLPAMGLSFLADESFHKWMALVCFLIAIVAFIPGIRKHGNWTPISIASVGLILITFAAFGLAGECCASCAAGSSNTANASLLASDGSDEGCAQCAQCTDCASCCEGNEAAINALVSANAADKTMLSTLAPWITPFGGLLLVSAHLLNRRHGCLCGCC